MKGTPSFTVEFETREDASFFLSYVRRSSVLNEYLESGTEKTIKFKARNFGEMYELRGMLTKTLNNQNIKFKT